MTEDRLFHCDWRALAERIERADTLIVDAPYSAKTHTHTGRSASAAARMPSPKKAPRQIPYPSWSPEDVRDFVGVWSPKINGWFVSLTDHILAPAWTQALAAAGRYVFAPFPLVEIGSRVRLGGDGPSCWAVQVIVARPRSRAACRWGALPGAYVVNREWRKSIIGGKPLEAMRRIVVDYSRPGDLVVDPCAGGGTTLLAAQLEGRRYIGCDIDAAHVEIARERLRQTQEPRKIT